MRNIAVVTGTRAEYGLLYHIMKEIAKSTVLNLKLIITGTHLSERFGYTIKDIISDGFDIEMKVELPLDTENGTGIAHSLGSGVIGFSQAFSKIKPDILLILGDRYEIFAAASAAMCMGIPIAHISGGESTEGAIDEQIRHAVTKMAHIHFPANDFYRDRVMRMGEEPWRVFVAGDPGIENIRRLTPVSKEVLEKELNLDLSRDTVLITYHPVTNERQYLKEQVHELLKALGHFPFQKVFTYPNGDEGGNYIIEKINEYVKSDENARVVTNLGRIKYLSILRYIRAMIGNSSSGIVEAPSFQLPVVNIGSRQQGRLKAMNIIDCGNKSCDIIEAINKALFLPEFKESLAKTVNLYGDGNTSETIVKILETIPINKKLINKKLYY